MKNASEKSSVKTEVTGWDSAELQPTGSGADGNIVGFGPLLTCWQAIDGRIRVVMSRDGEVLANSDGAARLFVQNDSLTNTAIFSLACVTSSARLLKRLLGAPVGMVETIVLPKRTGDGHFVVSAVGISAAAVAITIREADDNFLAVYPDLEGVFGLTHCEALVVVRLMRGYCAQRIANDLDVSVHTVRAHLRHSYDKLGVRSREELWQRLAPYRLN